MTLTATPKPAEERPHVLVVLAGGAAATEVHVVRVASDGSTSTLPESVKTDASGRGTARDYRAPFGGAFRYRTVTATPETSGEVVLTSDVPWLIHPFNPSLSMAVAGAGLDKPSFGAAAFASTSLPSNTSLVEALGRDAPVAIRVGRRRARSSQMAVRTRTRAQELDFLALVEDDSPLLLNVPPDLGWGVDTTWVQIGDVQVSRRATTVTDPYRSWEFPYRVVSEPVGTVASEWTYGQHSQVVATYADETQLWATYGDLEIDRRKTA